MGPHRRYQAILLLACLLTGCIEPSPRSDVSESVRNLSFEPPPPVPAGARPGGSVGPAQPEEAIRPLVGGLVLAAVRGDVGGDPDGGVRILLRGIRA